MWWIQRVAPATLTAGGLVRTAVYGPFQCGAKESCFQSLTDLISGHKFMNLLPKGEWQPFLCKLSSLTYDLTQLFHLLWNLISPYLRQICWHLFYYGRASHMQFCTEKSRGTVGSSWVWAEPSETSPPRNSQTLRSTWRVSLSVWLVHSIISELWGLYAVCNFHLMFKVLLTCYTKSAMKARPLSDPMLVGNPNLGTISLSRHQATFNALSVLVGKASTHPENIHTMTSR